VKGVFILLLGGACLVTGCAVSVEDGRQPPDEDNTSVRADNPSDSPAVEPGTTGRARIIGLPSVYSDPINKPTPDPWFAIKFGNPTHPWSSSDPNTSGGGPNTSGSDPNTSAGADSDDTAHSSNGIGDGTSAGSTPSSTPTGLMPMR
jgi:hypothetical protein